ncbi:MAG TPA: FecR domain-containing protein [Gaiellaceae bacterium]|nr:FecR domain-containing protein [Gaiellaceae bacterium]
MRRTALAGLVLLVGALCTWEVSLARSASPKILDTVTVDATKSSGTQSSVSLKAGTAYLLRIKGTATAPGGGVYDALYCVSGTSGGAKCPTRTASLMVSTSGASSYPQPDQAVDAFQKATPNSGCAGETSCSGGLAYSASHAYTVTFYPPATGRVTFGTDPQLKLHTAYFTSGSYTIQIEEGTASTPVPAGAKARVTSFSGEVSVRRGSGAWTPVTAGFELQPSDEISTGVDSHALLTFEDGSTMQLDELTQILAHTLLFKEHRKEVELQLAVGAIKATVQHETALETSFRIRQATATASVRGTEFDDFYDPGSKTVIVAARVDSVLVQPTRAGAKAVVVPPGKEVEVTPTAVSTLAPIGKADAHGGIDRAAAYRLVEGVIDRATAACGLNEPAGKASFSTRPTAAGWAVTVPVAGKASGSTSWTAAGSKATPANALAKRIAAHCSGGPTSSDPSGSWVNVADASSPAWVFKASGSSLTATWKGSGAHAALRGSFSGSQSSSGNWSGTFSITENATHVTGTMTVRLTAAGKLVVMLTPTGGSPSTITFRRSG